MKIRLRKHIKNGTNFGRFLLNLLIGEWGSRFDVNGGEIQVKTVIKIIKET